VRFKRASRHFLLHPGASLNITVGDFVRCEGDRGDDLGVVQSKVSQRDFQEEMPRTAGYRGRGFSSDRGSYKWIYRLATTTERLQIRDKALDELEALEVVSAKVALRHLPMEIIDAEYQFDRHKLVFFFAACRRIDFRDLVAELFGLYKTRIWMQQVDPVTLDADGDSAGTLLAKQAGFLAASPHPGHMQHMHMHCSHVSYPNPPEPVPVPEPEPVPVPMPHKSNLFFLDFHAQSSTAWRG